MKDVVVNMCAVETYLSLAVTLLSFPYFSSPSFPFLSFAFLTSSFQPFQRCLNPLCELCRVSLKTLQNRLKPIRPDPANSAIKIICDKIVE